MHRPLRAEAVKFYHNDALKGWSVNGTPSDCVKLAIEYLLPERPDLVISGINNGANLGTDVLYSGTVSAAIEAIILGIPALAVSLTEQKNPIFILLILLIIRMLKKIFTENTFKYQYSETGEEIAGVAVTRLGTGRNAFQKGGSGKELLLAGEAVDTIQEDEDSDCGCPQFIYLRTPIHLIDEL